MIKKNIVRSKSDTKYYTDKASFEVTNYNLALLKKEIKNENLSPKVKTRDKDSPHISDRLSRFNSNDKPGNLKSEDKEIRRKMVSILRMATLMKHNLEKFLNDKPYVNNLV